MDVHLSEITPAWIVSFGFFAAGLLIAGAVGWFVASRQIKYARAGTFGDGPHWQFADVQTVLAFAIVAAFIMIVLLLIYRPPTLGEGLRDTVMGLIGALSMKFSDVVAYFFNSTAQSKAKDETAKLTAQAVTTMAATITGTGPSTVTPAPAAGPTVSPPKEPDK